MQSQAPEESEIWVLSDVLAEGERRDFAETTAQNIVERRMRYSYFIPFSVGEGFNWQRAIRWIEDHMQSLDPKADLRRNVAVYQLSDCAFSARLRITNPRSNMPSARYSLGAREWTQAMFMPAPTDLVVSTVARLIELLARVEEAQHLSAPDAQSIHGEALGHPNLGFIRRLFGAPI